MSDEWRDEGQDLYYDTLRAAIRRLEAHDPFNHDLRLVIDALVESVDLGEDERSEPHEILCAACGGELRIGEESPLVNGSPYHPDCVDAPPRAPGFLFIASMSAWADEFEETDA